jgi:hypothetical protein
VTLGELTASTPRLALVGLAKNTGKTETLAALLRELGSLPGGNTARRVLGVTSVGRDGEQRDVIDARIEKPRIRLPGGSLVATTDVLLRASGLPHELLEATGYRTPLGEVLIARLRGAGAVEVAGPNAAGEVRAVSHAMLTHGAEQVLIDGAIDRRAASSPSVADGLVIASGAVLDHDISAVVSRTKDAVDLVRLPHSGRRTSNAGSLLRELGSSNSALLGGGSEPVRLPPGFVLSSEPEQVAQLLEENPGASWLIVAGALPERFLLSLLNPLRRRRRALELVVADPTKVFLTERGPAWYRTQGVHLQALERTPLIALTVNPIAPQSHRFDSERLRALLRLAIPDTPILDVLHPDYRSAVDPSPPA